MTDDVIDLQRWKSWTKAEADLYAGQRVRVIGEHDLSMRVLVEFMSGPLNGERRWFTMQELAGNAAIRPTRE